MISNTQEHSLSFLWYNTFCCAALFSFETKWTESDYSGSDFSSISPFGNQLLFWRGYLSKKKKKKQQPKPRQTTQQQKIMDRKTKPHDLCQLTSYSHLWIIYISSVYNISGKYDYKCIFQSFFEGFIRAETHACRHYIWG